MNKPTLFLGLAFMAVPFVIKYGIIPLTPKGFAGLIVFLIGIYFIYKASRED